jgi:hypothetical protein
MTRVAYRVRIIGSDVSFRPSRGLQPSPEGSTVVEGCATDGSVVVTTTVELSRVYADLRTARTGVIALDVPDEVVALRVRSSDGLEGVLSLPTSSPVIEGELRLQEDRLVGNYAVHHPDGARTMVSLERIARSGETIIGDLPAGGPLDLDLGLLGGGRFSVAVVVRDGIHETVLNGPEVFQPTAAELVITRPSASEYLTSREDVALDARVVSTGDAVARGQWNSDLDGVLAETPEAVCRLSPGHHRLEFTDRTGASASVEVDVAE